ncbi:SRPBCC domain-containing protein [Arsenicicoccus sp. oral taxon 190]|uniref:SRPBCC domain-containing protein n=1 Tax=Arsenicicoccus sp. oral taxon 190 TaxID=1658671 RepID=UPI00067C7E5B|nr:SRPBCC family protein [Arsenicicoccus sp. oral taxon 190]
MVAATPEQVWRVLTDLERAPQVRSNLRELEPVTGLAYRVGCQWRETRVTLGRPKRHLMRVAEIQQPWRTVVTGTTDGVDHVTTTDLTRHARGTRLALTLGVRHADATPAQRLLWWLLRPVCVRVARTMLATEIADIGAEAERAGR